MTKNPRRSPNAATTSGVKAKVKDEVAASGKRQRPQTKKQIALSLLRRPKGASIPEMQEAMGWQPHSVRGLLAGTIRKMPGVVLLSEKPESGPRRYHAEISGA